jgi:hypothetical protein
MTPPTVRGRAARFVRPVLVAAFATLAVVPA